ncbi:hypothetical protein ACW9IK_19835 [Pseudomonas gingeri]
MNVKLIGKLSWMMTLFIALLACSGLAMLRGWGTGIEWHPSPDPKPLAAPRAEPVVTAPAPLQSYSDIWNQSLFNQDRASDPIATVQKAEAGAPSLNGLALTGVVISPPLHKVFFKTADGASLGLNEGEALPSGWRVEKIQSDSVSLSYKSTRQELTLPALKVPAEALR